MGGENQPQQVQGNQQAPVRVPEVEEEDDFYILEEINKLSFKGNRNYIYYWIDPKIFNN